MQSDERSTHGESTNSEPVAAPDQPVLQDFDVQTKSDERQADHHEPTDAEHPCPPENDQDTPPVSVPEELESEEQGSEMEEEAALEQDPRLSRPQRAHRATQMFTYNTLGQPTMYGVQTAPYPVPRWPHPPLQSPWITPMYQYLAPSCYGPLAYPYVYVWCILMQIY